MSARCSISYFSSCHLCLLILLVLLPLCLSVQKSDDVLCIDGERQALIRFKDNLVDESDRLASWVGEKSDCCRWAGIVCDNITGHVHEINLRGLDGHCDPLSFSYDKELTEGSKQMLRGNLSPSLLELKQLEHLDLSCNDFEEIQIPSFIGSLRNLRYLNLSESKIHGIIPPQIGNLSELRALSLGSWYGIYGDPERTLKSTNMQWLSSLRWLQHLDMSNTNLSKATDWFHVINTLPSLLQLDMSRCGLTNAHPHVPNLNVTSLSMLDLSSNYFDKTSVPGWIFSLTNLVSLDLCYCHFDDHLPSIYSFDNLTFLKSLHVCGNGFMKSPLVIKGISSNLISLDMSFCGLSSSILDLLGNLCNLREIDLSSNDFSNISLTYLLQSLFKCKSPSLESLSIIDSELSGLIPYAIGQLSSLKSLRLDSNKLNGSIPDSIGRLSSLEELYISWNQLSGNIPSSIGQLSKLESFWFSYNLLTGVVTEAHFANLTSLAYLNGAGNNLTIRPQAADWIPPFQLRILYLHSLNLGPQFPLWLQSQRDLIRLVISNTSISSLMPPESFWRSFPNLTILDMSQNHIKGTLTLGIPASLVGLDLSSNEFSGELPSVSNGSLIPEFLDLSNNYFVGSHHFLCSNGVENAKMLGLGNNSLSGVIPECWEKWRSLMVLNMENNNLSGEIPRTVGSIPNLVLLNMRGNKISGRLPASLVNLTRLRILQLDRNKLVGSIPSWVGTKLTLLIILNLRSNNLSENIPHELCHLSSTQILDLAENYLSGNIPRCFYNFSVLSEKEYKTNSISEISFGSDDVWSTQASETLVWKGREYTYESTLNLVRLLDLSSNNLSGHIPSELTTLQGLKSLNLTRNQLTGRIPEQIGDMKALESFDLSFNKLSGELPMSLSLLTFLSSLNVSYNKYLTGRIPTGTQLQSFDMSSYFGNKLCGAPLGDCRVPVDAPTNTKGDKKKDDGSDWGLIISIVLRFLTGFWIIVAPLTVSTSWRIAYFSLMRKLIKV